MNDKQKSISFAQNVQSLRRSDLLQSMINVGKDINFSCGYPNFITMADYRALYDREGIAKRVVNILPQASWSVQPEIVETDNNASDESEFEKSWKVLEEQFRFNHYLERVDKLSGIGRYGVLLLGLNDGLELSKPVAGVNPETGEKIGDTKLEMLFLRPFDENSVEVARKDKSTSSPRFGFPIEYSIMFESSSQLSGSTATTHNVHWTRLIHIADNREVSEVYGIPRMKGVYNRLLDIRKILSGSGEMFWKGAFPGYAFEINKDIKNPKLDTASLREEFENYSNGLQRYLAIEGVTAKSLQPQVSDPSGHLKSQIEYIAISLGIPLRIFIGSEQAKLASTQDKETYNSRISYRQNRYVSPMIIKPFIERLISFGVMPKVENGYSVSWPDLNTVSDKDIAEVSRVKTEALAKYVVGSVDALIPPKEFLTMIMSMSEEDATLVEMASKKFISDRPDPEPDTGGDDE